MLRFSKEQMAGLGEDRLAASHQKIARMLRENAPEDTAPLDDAALLALAQRSGAAGRNLGIRTERGQAKERGEKMNVELEECPPKTS